MIYQYFDPDWPVDQRGQMILEPGFVNFKERFPASRAGGGGWGTGEALGGWIVDQEISGRGFVCLSARPASTGPALSSASSPTAGGDRRGLVTGWRRRERGQAGSADIRTSL
jgi:hypothetical protein